MQNCNFAQFYSKIIFFQRTGGRIGKPDLTRPYHWAQNSVCKMLSNQEYVGDTVNFKTYTKSNKLKKEILQGSRKRKTTA